VDEEREAYLDGVLIGGREPAEISVVDYDERWPTRFREIAERLRRAVEEDVVGVEHIGSTSVPGLAAKPIVDVLLTVADVSNEAAYVPALESAGFLLRVREPAHRMVRTPARDVHVHVYEPGRQEVRDYIDLRDWLRVDAEDRELYAATKRMLARQQWSDMNDYADAKTEVISDVLTRARAWRAGAMAPRAKSW
jgi:GrpB-like predicted nucleotidyltransferase (UPF0157 family)